jgi:SNF2 family DNA or RNA helicase
MDEERIVKSATGIRNTRVWKKLYKFQRDGVVGAIDKLERFGGCIIADSVGLGKTFEALAVIKYYELRNDRVLVLVPKRLRDNWTLYKANDRRNILAADRFNYDVLNHTDLSRDGGSSGDIDLAHVNWGNYDLVVIDESHNFRNKKNHRDRESRYDRLMRQDHQGGRQDQGADALGHAGQQPPGRSEEPDRLRHRRRRRCAGRARHRPASRPRSGWRRSSSTAGSQLAEPERRPRG